MSGIAAWVAGSDEERKSQFRSIRKRVTHRVNDLEEADEILVGHRSGKRLGREDLLAPPVDGHTSSETSDLGGDDGQLGTESGPHTLVEGSHAVVAVTD
jgi:hypothetical protein